jgi:hypothetical protein
VTSSRHLKQQLIDDIMPYVDSVRIVFSEEIDIDHSKYNALLIDEADAVVDLLAVKFQGKDKLYGFNLAQNYPRVHMFSGTCPDFFRKLCQRLPPNVVGPNWFNEF